MFSIMSVQFLISTFPASASTFFRVVQLAKSRVWSLYKLRQIIGYYLGKLLFPQGHISITYYLHEGDCFLEGNLLFVSLKALVICFLDSNVGIFGGDNKRIQSSREISYPSVGIDIK